jgi:hypothetical protein
MPYCTGCGNHVDASEWACTGCGHERMTNPALLKAGVLTMPAPAPAVEGTRFPEGDPPAAPAPPVADAVAPAAAPVAQPPSKALTRLSNNVQTLLAPGERLLGCVRAFPEGNAAGSLGMVAGLLVGAVLQTILTSRSIEHAKRSSFALGRVMAVFLTDRRLLIVQRSSFGKLKKVIGEVPLERLRDARVDKALYRHRITFFLGDALPVPVEVPVRDGAPEFARATIESLPVRPDVPADRTAFASGITETGRLRPTLLLAAVVAVGVLAGGAAFAAMSGGTTPVPSAKAPAATSAAPKASKARITLPDSMLGYLRLRGAEADALEKSVRNSGPTGALAHAAMYMRGESGFMLIAFQFAGEPGVTYFKQVANGVASGEGETSVDVVHITTTRSGSTSYTCAPLRGEIPGSACMWRDASTNGVVRFYGTDATHGMKLMSPLHRAVVGGTAA